MEMRDEDARHAQRAAVEHALPPFLRIRNAETGVDDEPFVGGAQRVAMYVIDPERQRKRDAKNVVAELDDVVSASSRRRPSRL
jgi:hypothetical protein